MEVLLPWFNLIACGLVFVTCAMVYLDGRGRRKALAVWKSATELQLGEHVAQLVDHAGRIAALEGDPGTPPAVPAPALARIAVGGASAESSPTPSESAERASAAPAAAPATPRGPRMRAEIQPSGFASDRHVAVYADRVQSFTFDARDVDEREGMVRVLVIDATSLADEVLVEFPAERVPRGHRTWVPRRFVFDPGDAPPIVPALESETPERIRARLEAAEDEREDRTRHGSSPTLVSAGNVPPSSESRPTYLECITDLSDAEIAGVDAAAARRRVTREAMLVILIKTALDEAEAEARIPAPTTPPDAPANDREPLPDGDGAPPPSGKRRE